MTTIQVLFASAQDTAETLARQIATDIVSHHLTPSLHCLSELGSSLSLAVPCVSLLVLGSAGEVAAPGQRFCRWVETLEEGSLAGMRVALLAVGSGAGAFRLEALLRRKGAETIVESGTATDQSAVEKWLSAVWKQLNIALRAVGECSGQSRVLASPSVPPSYSYSRLLSKRLLTESKSALKTLEICINSSGNSPAPGSLVAIYPDNDLAAVSEVIARFNFDANYLLEALTLVHPSVRWRVELPCTVFDYLQRFVDFSAPAPLYFAHYFAAHIRKREEKDPFERLISSVTSETLPIPYSILHLLRTFPDIEYFFLEETLPLLPPLHPRHYAVTSTPLVLAQSLNLAVQINGVCSKYLEKLANLELNRPVLLRTAVISDSEALWSPLYEATSPLLVAAGVGIAAFRGVLEQITLERRRPVRVVYACRQPVKGTDTQDCDFPYQDDVRGFLSMLGGKLQVITVPKGLDFEAALLAALREAADEIRPWAKAVALCGPFPTTQIATFLKELLPAAAIVVSHWS